MAKFRVGDLVKIREWDDMAKEYGVADNGDIKGNLNTYLKRYTHCKQRTETVVCTQSYVYSSVNEKCKEKNYKRCAYKAQFLAHD